MGYPANHKVNTWKRDNSKGNAYASTTNNQEESEGLLSAKSTKDQYQQKLDMLNKQDNKATSTHANISQLTCIFSLLTHSTDLWIIDSGASDHMCHDIHKFASCEAIEKEKHQVTIPDGTKLSIKYKGTIILNNGIFAQCSFCAKVQIQSHFSK